MNRAESILELAQALIRRVSVTPEDAGCQELIGELLRDLGFVAEQINAHGVHNLWAWRGRDPRETDATHLMFAGHTESSPPAPLKNGIPRRLSQPLRTVCCTGAVLRT